MYGVTLDTMTSGRREPPLLGDVGSSRSSEDVPVRLAGSARPRSYTRALVAVDAAMLGLAILLAVVVRFGSAGEEAPVTPEPTATPADGTAPLPDAAPVEPELIPAPPDAAEPPAAEDNAYPVYLPEVQR